MTETLSEMAQRQQEIKDYLGLRSLHLVVEYTQLDERAFSVDLNPIS